jgi:predicted nucleotidyltransferase
MHREEVITKLKQHEADLKRPGVQHLYLFGSTVREEARADSDVDLFVDYERGKFNRFDLMDVRELASNILGYKPDVTTRDSLRKMSRPAIEASAIGIF